MRITTILYLAALSCLLVAFGCAKQTLDPALYPADWPRTDITAPEGSTPAKFPPGYLDLVLNLGRKSDHAYSTNERVTYKECGICFNYPGGWDQVFNDINSKCKKSGMISTGVSEGGNLKLIVKSVSWVDMGGSGSVVLNQTSENSFVLEVTFWPDKGLSPFSVTNGD